MSTCRCGHNGKGDHPCHRCRKPAAQQFYNPRLVGLGMLIVQAEASGVWMCDECWAKFQQQLANDGGKA